MQIHWRALPVQENPRSLPSRTAHRQCQPQFPSDSGHGWRERPSVLFEIISEETRRLDERERRFASLQIPTLQACIRVEQSSPEAAIERRVSGAWRSEKFTGLADSISLPEIGIRLPLLELCERLVF